ncbi:fibroblast growth factor 1-like [Diabrotica undecimpunctata]|uniref:fibroblast growth factor 1-like n=1 Tax=Diabrotica undecimpunctata TaxID=50387 RepID=UPI003B63DE38
MSHDDRPFSNHVRLWCQNGYNLTIRSNGEVLGTDDDSDPDSMIEISSGGDVSLVRLLGINSQLYLCFDDNGELYGEKDPHNQGTVFIEAFSASYSTFQSTLGPKSWFIGIQRNGKPKSGKKTGEGQKATRFLPRR